MAVTVTPSPFRPIAEALVRHALISAGTLLVGKGFLPQSMVDTAISPLTDQIVGGLFVIGAAAWAWYRAQKINTVLNKAEPFVPDSVIKGPTA